jgi:hypothetical protein
LSSLLPSLAAALSWPERAREAPGPAGAAVKSTVIVPPTPKKRTWLSYLYFLRSCTSASVVAGMGGEFVKCRLKVL